MKKNKIKRQSILHSRKTKANKELQELDDFYYYYYTFMSGFHTIVESELISFRTPNDNKSSEIPNDNKSSSIT